MRSTFAMVAAALLVACGGSIPEPKEAQTQSLAAVRAAEEVGAEKDPTATLHLKYAKDQIEEAKKLVAEGDNHRAQLVLTRARADAELAIMLAKAYREKLDADKAEAEVAEMRKKVGK